MVLSGSVQWLHPNQRDRLVNLATSRLAVDGVLVIHSATPESWMAGTSHLVQRPRTRPAAARRDVGSSAGPARASGRPVVIRGGEGRHLERVGSSSQDAGAINAAIDAVNELLLGPGEYLLVAVRER